MVFAVLWRWYPCLEMFIMKTANKIKGVLKVPKTELEIETIGEPDIKVLPENEQHTFLETLLARIKELKANSEKQD